MTANKGIITSYKEQFPSINPEKFIEVQMKEIEIRSQELELKIKQSEKNFEFARESLKCQSEDLKDLRNLETKHKNQELLVFGIVIIMFFIVIMVALILDKDELLTDIIRSAGYIFGGGITGYGIGLQKGKIKHKAGKGQN